MDFLSRQILYADIDVCFIADLDEVVKFPENTEIFAVNKHTKIQVLEVNVGKASFFALNTTLNTIYLKWQGL